MTLFFFDATPEKPGVIEAEDLETKSIDNSQRSNQTVGNEYQQLFWNAQGINNVMEMNLNLKKDVNSLNMFFSKGPDHGTFQLFVDGANIGTPVDLYSNVLASGNVNFGGLDLKAGKHVLKVLVTGKSGSGYSFGLDRIEYPVSVTKWRLLNHQ